MSVVLGIDAAWTEKEPSGVALISQGESGWCCDAVAPSYDAFVALANGIPVDWAAGRFTGSRPNLERLLTAVESLLPGRHVSLIAVDMPLALKAIEGRRPADDEIARAFGRYGCSPHSPTVQRPGAIATQFREAAAACGYDLATATTPAGSPSRLIEVYPHPALLALLPASYRVPYKVGKSRRYWPASTLAERKGQLIEQFACIRDALSVQIANIPLVLPDPSGVATASGLKRYEDALDALICAWVGSCYLARRATAYGDTHAAIWVPSTNGD